MGILDSFIQFNQPRSTTTRSSSAGKAAVAKSSGDGKQAPVVLQRGEVIRGEIIDLRSKEVTVRLQDGRTINAKLSDASSLYIGQKADFFVQETTDSVILLRLMPDGDTNFADNTINKALEAAGLPKTAHTTAIVSALLEENLPVSKDHIRQFMQLASQNREASLSTLALLMKHNLPVTKENVRQFEAFRNYEHRLTEQITTLTDTLTSLVSESTQTGNTSASELQKQLLSLLTGGTAQGQAETGTAPTNEQQNTQPFSFSASFNEAPFSERVITQEATVLNSDGTFPASTATDGKIGLSTPLGGVFFGQTEDGLSGNPLVQTTGTEITANYTTPEQQTAAQTQSAAMPQNSLAGTETAYSFSTLSAFLSKEECAALSNQLQQLFANTDSELTQSMLSHLTEQIADGTLETSHFFTAVSTLAEQFPHEANTLFRDTTYQSLFAKALSRHFLLTPNDLQEEQSITRYYERFESELSMIRHTLEQTQQNNPAADSAKQVVSNMQDNMQFMNSLNSLFPYVQLPLKFMEQTSHGELYVYTKKRELAQNGSSISVLLHLDMNHLGPIDIHLSLTGKSVAAKFYLEEEVSKQITQNNLHSLSDALAKKGYSLSSEVLTRETKPDPVKEFMQDTTTPFMKRYTFDIRA